MLTGPLPRRGRIATLDRVAIDGAIIAVAVPALVLGLVPARFGGCSTDELAPMAFGLLFLGARLAWPLLKAANDAAERLLGSIEGRPPADPPDTPSRTPTP